MNMLCELLSQEEGNLEEQLPQWESRVWDRQVIGQWQQCESPKTNSRSVRSLRI